MPELYIPRLITKEAIESAKEYQILTISGPRQSGKNTLVLEASPLRRVSNPGLETLVYIIFNKTAPGGKGALC